MEEYVARLEQEGHQVHLPHRDTDQSGRGYQINLANMEAIKKADEVHIFYSPLSQGTHFDMGVSFALGKKIRIVESVPIPEGKSYQGLLAEWYASQNHMQESSIPADNQRALD
ncbi:MAG: nucleoside 2-deoxyribosyltransferase [Bacteroidetes bacterium]|nr:nucleoside 2-deoxyribosyltransferase [Bacteroidota bacterium]